MLSERTRSSVAVLLDRSASAADYSEAAAALFDDLCGFAGILEVTPGEQAMEEIWTDDGLAISTGQAARCITDFMRTARFMQGVGNAIEQAIAEATASETGPVRVLYAGTGPFAALLVPQLHRWSANDIQVELIDIHAHNIEIARKLSEQLGVSNRISHYTVADAANHTISPHRRPNVLIVETLQLALQKEPQVAITQHLVPQCSPDTILVPETIEVRATAMLAGERIDLGTAMLIDAGTAAGGGVTGSVSVPTRLSASTHLLYRTIITVQGGLVLSDNDCELTRYAPAVVTPSWTDAESLRFTYSTEPFPHLSCHTE